MKKAYLAACMAAALGAASMARAAVVFGNFEGSQSDGFGSFSNTNGVIPFASDTTGTAYSYSSYGATNGTTALELSKAGFTGGNLAFDFKANNLAAAFLANDIISFDMTAPISGTTAGYWQVYSMTLNAPGAGFVQNVGGNPIGNEYPPFDGRAIHVSVNYDAVKATISANPSYLQMILSTNNGGGAPTDFYFDNFQLSSVPEPTSAGLLGVAGLGLIARRRR